MSIFRVCTIYNKRNQYDEMRASFAQAGFTDDNTNFRAFDNGFSNGYEPFSAFNKALEENTDDYMIFCHQDIMLNKGYHFEHLYNIVTEMNRSHPTWAVLGNAGVSLQYKHVINITDPQGTVCDDALPKRVVALDENFLVVKPSAGLRFSEELNGFHFYGADICLHAAKKGFSCFVIGFHLTHNSAGNFKGDFALLRTKFEDHWSGQYGSKRFRLTFVPTACICLTFSRYKIVRRIVRKQLIGKTLRKYFPKHFEKMLADLLPVE